MNQHIQDDEEVSKDDGLSDLVRRVNIAVKYTGNEDREDVRTILKHFGENCRTDERRKVEEEKEQFVDALLDMYGQYCSEGHDFMSAG